MYKFVIKKCEQLKGEINVSGAKNSALPLMAATLLAPGKYEISNIPALNDIRTMINVLISLGAVIEWDKNKETLYMDTSKTESREAPYELVKTMRASAVVLGPLLARFGKARVSMPGGCAIGARPLDIHLRGFEELGAKITVKNGYIEALTKQKLKGKNITLSFPSVGATENLIMAATISSGKTIIMNAAREPEIVDLANMLNKMGAKISCAGENRIEITGVKKLQPVNYSVIPDRIETGTFMIAGSIIPGTIKIKNVITEHSLALITKLRETGVTIEKSGKNSLVVCAPKRLKPTNIATMPFPGFPTDMQAQFCALLILADGVSQVRETVFENRFLHTSELNRLGAKISIDRNTAKISGVKQLTGAKLTATDLRASAALVLAGLAAKGKTEIYRIYHIDRGYERIEKKLGKIGADIQRVETDEM